MKGECWWSTEMHGNGNGIANFYMLQKRRRKKGARWLAANIDQRKLWTSKTLLWSKKRQLIVNFVGLFVKRQDQAQLSKLDQSLKSTFLFFLWTSDWCSTWTPAKRIAVPSVLCSFRLRNDRSNKVAQNFATLLAASCRSGLTGGDRHELSAQKRKVLRLQWRFQFDIYR